jgi:macrolide-specific efflux system membrane fusion protein
VRKTVVAVTVIAVIGIAVVILARAGARSGGDQPLAGGEAIRVTRRDIGTLVKATGVIRPMIGAEVRVGSRISGVVRRLFVRVGDRVRKGQLLAELDDRELVARRAEAVGAVELSQANLQFARSDLRRKRELHAEQLIAPADLDVAERACAIAEKQHAQAEASLEYASTQISYSRIAAPISGIVASVATQEGETVAASFATPTFVTLVDLQRLEVRAYVDETDIGHIRPGQAARFTVDTYGNREVRGRVATVYPQAEIRDNVVNYVTIVTFTAPTGFVLRPEMTAAVQIAVDERAGVLAVPLRAVRREGGRPFVLCEHDGAVEKRWVTTGVRDEHYWEISDGLRDGERVLVGDVAPK